MASGKKREFQSVIYVYSRLYKIIKKIIKICKSFIASKLVKSQLDNTVNL